VVDGRNLLKRNVGKEAPDGRKRDHKGKGQGLKKCKIHKRATLVPPWCLPAEFLTLYVIASI